VFVDLACKRLSVLGGADGFWYLGTPSMRRIVLDWDHNKLSLISILHKIFVRYQAVLAMTLSDCYCYAVDPDISADCDDYQLYHRFHQVAFTMHFQDTL